MGNHDLTEYAADDRHAAMIALLRRCQKRMAFMRSVIASGETFNAVDDAAHEATMADIAAMITAPTDEGNDVRSRKPARDRVAGVMNDRKGFHVDYLDDEIRHDLLDAIVLAALGLGS